MEWRLTVYRSVNSVQLIGSFFYEAHIHQSTNAQSKPTWDQVHEFSVQKSTIQKFGLPIQQLS